ncbi:amino acid permease [Kurthia sibirica]|uniref:Glutamate:gamma-aminobutyrate antiporter n=1 Tax=Kurthia sibirica TaxID=202750 RepID=A0A2U3AMX1_9BACL|nr:amino acid permease [Kurthia sibirica]PWI25875.1 glutamate:gamma-aminobutyrate antiporter [Kurthia sibirica]GEK34315.1 glutamate:gamma-aminobutyrate antiporter [Kurthia sibirica]
MATDKKKLSQFSFFAMTASLFITVYEYPTFAESGVMLIFYLLVCGIFWFLPVALCSAELATIEGYQEGGIFGWVGKILGEKYGFAAIFFQWFQITVGFVTMIYFIIGALAYALKIPEINSNSMLKFLCVLVIFWALTFMQFKGTQLTAKVAKAGFIFGIIIPVLLLLVFAIKYFVSGHAVAHSFTSKGFFPENKESFAALVSFMLAYMGVEASAPHIKDLDNPQKNYPKIMVILVVVGITLSTIGGSVVSMVIPDSKLSLNTGVVQAFEALILTGHPAMAIVVKIIAVLLAFGVIAQVSSWIVSPTEGLRTVAEKGLLPAKFKKVNKNGVPVPLIYLQGIVVTVWAAILTFGGGGNNVSFLTAISLTVIIYLSAYILLFISYFFLVLKPKNQSLVRSYQVPGGKIGKLIISASGLIISVLAIISAFIAPSELKHAEASTYIMTLSAGFIITLVLPFVFYHFYSKHKKTVAKGS